MLLVLLFTVSASYAQMSDAQIVDFVKKEKSFGKADKEIGKELMRRGVTKEQLLQLKNRAEREQQLENQVQKQSSEVVRVGDREIDTNAEEVVPAENLKEQEGAIQIFGKNVFSQKSLTFEPNENMATPAHYKLGPGDEVVIEVWGNNESTIRQVISPEGNIMVPQVGPIFLSGMTIAEANYQVRDHLSRIYSGVAGENPESEIRVTLGQIRSIQINVMGEVKMPGTYRLSAFSTIFHALYRAGGVSNIGTLRNIALVRGGKKIATMDVYDYLLKGKINTDIRLEEGDVIIVDPYEVLVNVEGNVKRPMFYELKKGETLANVLHYAGGFAGNANTKEIRVARSFGKEKQMYSVMDNDFNDWQIADGDVVTISAVLDRFANRVEIKGAVYRPGTYEVGTEINTVKQLIERAEGLTGDAFLDRVQIIREREDLTNELIAFDLGAILSGKQPDIKLQREDILMIPSIHDLEAHGSFTIQGEVNFPGMYPYADNTTLEDLIVQAGGMLDGASSVKVDVARRLKDPKSTEATNELSKNFTFAVKDGYVIDGEEGFILEPYDVVVVRRSPGYKEQRMVSVNGEVTFAGGYALAKKTERLSDLVERAGGVTNNAYVHGARLIRRMNAQERAQHQAAIDMARMNAGKDSIALNKLQTLEYYTVGIELDKALAKPGSDYDVVLREGDNLVIPEYANTVRIRGEVLYPNTVSYMAGQKLKYYINQAGGFGKMAAKRQVYIVHMNGTVTRAKGRGAKIEPGCEIIIPTKKERKRLQLGEIMTLTSGFASLATMAATITNLVK